MSTPEPERGYLIDMDGVLYRGLRPISGAHEFLNDLQTSATPFLLLTNHSCFTPRQLQEKLASIEMEIALDHFYSSAMATAEWLKIAGVRCVYAVGEEGLFAALAENGIEVGDKNVTHVVVGLDRALNYEKLKVAARLIAGGAQFIGTNPDPTYPVEDGDAPECGLLLGALRTVTGKEPLVIGKPQPAIFHQAAQRLNVPLNRLTMIGDRLDTDIDGALGVGARGVLLLTGHTTRAMLKNSTIVPDEVWDDLKMMMSG